MLEKHLKSCVKKQVLEGNDEALDEIVNLMKKL
jgi:DNA-binding FrmR family transcriptional regulator